MKMKRAFSLFLALIMAMSCFSCAQFIFAADGTTVQTAVELPCDSKWKSFSGNSSSAVYYRITVADTGKLKLKIKTSSEYEATLTDESLTTSYYTLYSVSSDSETTTVKNQVISAGVYYLSVKCSGSYKIKGIFGGNCYENPQTLKTETEVTGSKTTNEDGWWYKVKITKKTVYRLSATAYGNLTVNIYNSNLSTVVESITLSGSKKSPVTKKENITLSKGKYYIKVSSDKKYKLSICKLTKKNCDHTYVTETVKSTYTTKGYVKHTCTICGYSYKDNYTAVKKLSVPAASISAKTSTMTVKSSRVYRASGYQIQYSTSSNFTSSSTKSIKTTALTKKISGLKRHTKYYVRVRAYKTVDSKTVYSSWSEAKAITTKS